MSWGARSKEGSARACRARAVGRRAGWRRSQAARGAAEPAAPAAGAARRSLARARDVARVRRDPVAPICLGLSNCSAVARGFAQSRVSRRPLLGPKRSHPPRRRGGRSGRPCSWRSGARRPLRQGRQSRRRAAGPRVEQPSSPARAPHTHGDASRARLRPAELQEAPPRGARRRPSQLGAVVQRMVPADAGAIRRPSRRAAEDLARDRWLATRGRRDRRRRASWRSPCFTPGRRLSASTTAQTETHSIQREKGL